ncbi:hypothetical protein N657DRAFT_264920 [Parathielavia appendiculata]|uniref:Uncharacterized protein n=1 Tax=Parathielavia appendiculata TaxID=2587402 RepID=A0AAN6U333_9PEZI|nr:hypothetical protein N657DRAFT_264920 [Parathielavia appendiculata]
MSHDPTAGGACVNAIGFVAWPHEKPCQYCEWDGSSQDGDLCSSGDAECSDFSKSDGSDASEEVVEEEGSQANFRTGHPPSSSWTQATSPRSEFWHQLSVHVISLALQAAAQSWAAGAN